MNSFQLSVKAKMPAEIRPGTASGRVIFRRICRQVTSSIRAHSPQPDRAGLRQAQGAAVQGRRAQRRGLMERHRPATRPNQAFADEASDQHQNTSLHASGGVAPPQIALLDAARRCKSAESKVSRHPKAEQTREAPALPPFARQEPKPLAPCGPVLVLLDVGPQGGTKGLPLALGVRRTWRGSGSRGSG